MKRKASSAQLVVSSDVFSISVEFFFFFSLQPHCEEVHRARVDSHPPDAKGKSSQVLQKQEVQANRPAPQENASHASPAHQARTFYQNSQATAQREAVPNAQICSEAVNINKVQERENLIFCFTFCLYGLCPGVENRDRLAVCVLNL